MDNVCHTLVGLALGQAGLKHKTALAMPTLAIAANLPDIDVLVFATGVPSVAFRRGITHGVPAQVLLSASLAGLMWLLARRGNVSRGPGPHAGWLLALSAAGILTHVFLDFLNTYGIRLLSPVSQRWFYGDAVFIVDVWLWLVLGAGTFLAGSLRHTSTTPQRPARARIALLGASLYIATLLVSARASRAIVEAAWLGRSGTPSHKLMVGPLPFTPFRKAVIVDAGDRYVEGTFQWLPLRVSFEDDATLKNDALPAVTVARHDPAVRGILVWSRFPVWETREVPGGTEVRLRDMRFRGIDRGGFATTTTVPR